MLFRSMIHVQNGTTTQGYMNFPYSEVFFNTNGNSAAVNVMTEGSSTAYSAGTRDYQVLGSILCKSFGTGNKPGVIYIKQNNDADDKGNKLFNWNEKWYSRV